MVDTGCFSGRYIVPMPTLLLYLVGDKVNKISTILAKHGEGIHSLAKWSTRDVFRAQICRADADAAAAVSGISRDVRLGYHTWNITCISIS